MQWLLVPIVAVLISVYTAYRLGINLPSLQSNRMRKVRGPMLDVVYDPCDTKCWRVTTESMVQAAQCGTKVTAPARPGPLGLPPSRPVLYLSVRVENRLPKAALQCRGYLMEIEKWENGNWVSKYTDSLPLIWAFDPDGKEKNVLMGTPLYLNVVAIRADNCEFEPQLYSGNGPGNPLRPNALQPIVTQPGKYRITVTISADDCEPKTVKIPFNCDGNPWQSIAA